MQAIRSKLCTVVSQISNLRNSSCHEYIQFKNVLLKIIHKLTCTGEIKKTRFELVHYIYETDHSKEDRNLNYSNGTDVTRKKLFG